MTYYLNVDRMRVVQRNDRGVVTYRKRYTRGDEVDTSKIEDAQVENLLRTGALVESQGDVRERGTGAAPYRGSEVTGAATGEAGDNPEHNTDLTASAEGENVDPSQIEAVYVDGANTARVRDDSEGVVDQYSEMDYRELQAEAGDRDLPATGSADDLRARLRASDNS